MLAIFTRKYQKTFFVSETAIFVEIEIEIENTCSRTGEQKVYQRKNYSSLSDVK